MHFKELADTRSHINGITNIGYIINISRVMELNYSTLIG